MSRHTEVQIISQGGRPAFAVVPYDEWLALTGQQEETGAYIPHEVVGLQLHKGLSLLAAWRVHQGLSQQELADRMGVSQSSVAQMERPGVNPRRGTLERAATALGITVAQLED